jgi:peptidoglycan-associated lipoprotein
MRIVSTIEWRKIMQIKKLVQVLLIGGAILTLSACKAPNHAGDDQFNAAGNDAMSGGADASGAGQGSNFGDEGGANAKRSAKNTYYFDYDRSDVRSEDKPGIYSNADYLVAHSNAKVIVEGHTDPRGSREYNVALAERRADAVADLLKSRGVNPSQIRIVSYGAERPAVPGRTEQDFQLDRRAIIVYVKR